VSEITPEIREAVSAVDFPIKLQMLFDPCRYKVLYGGRGGAKSWGVARALLVIGVKKPTRVLCAREFQNSIGQSVHKLLSDQIIALKLESFYEITQNSIRGKNGTEFAFVGLKNNVTNIKSFEGVDLCWVEEAQSVSKTSWNILIPTIRKEKSEIWVTFNPELESDETYQRFVVSPPENCKVAKINWSDNPWFPDTLKLEKDALFNRDREAYNTVWEGLCRQTVDGAIFAKELTMAELDGRICNVPYDPIKPCHVVFDLGWADSTAYWVVQFIAQEVRLIRYHEDNQQTIAHYLGKIQSYGYVIDTIWLPHDAGNKTLASHGKSIEEVVRAANFNTRVIERTPIVDSINAARMMFNKCWFDRINTHEGLQCLRHYRYDVDPDTKQFSQKPLHDNYSHGADAFRYIGLMVNEPRKAPKQKSTYNLPSSWMG
jgi:phage terminase large subunit